jgi:hypothetical protein
MEAGGEQDHISSVDWTEWYSDPSVWPSSRHVFLADAAIRLGRSMILPWEDHLLSHAGDDHLPLPGGLDWSSPDRPLFDDGSGMVRTELSMDEGLSRPVGWTDEDEVRLYDADVHNGIRHDARLAAKAIARALAKLAARGSIRTYARPIGGGPLEDIDPSDWEVDDPVGRLASCRMTPGSPSAAATGTHLIFMETEGLTKKLTAYAREKPLALNSGRALPADRWIDGMTPKDRLVAQCEEALRTYLSTRPSDWKKETMRDVVAKTINRPFSDSVFYEARELVKKDFPHIGNGGRPRGS